MITSATFENPMTGIRITIRYPSEATHRHIAVHHRYVRTDPLYNGNGQQIGWHTKPADWFLSWGWRTRHGTRYTYEGLENEEGFKTKREAQARKRELEIELGWRRRDEVQR